MKRTITTEHSRYVLDYDSMTYTRERRHPDATYLPRFEAVDCLPFSSVEFVGVNGDRLQMTDTATGYWSISTPITSDSGLVE